MITIILFTVFLIIILFWPFSVAPLNKQNVLTNKNINDYYKLLYGNDAPNITMDDFLQLDILFKKLLDKAKINIDFLGNFLCPNNNLTPMINMTSFFNSGGIEVPDTIWIYNKPPYKPVLSNKWVEVTHCASWVSNDFEQKGAWFYLAKGSNIFINTGVTIVFKTHIEAVKYFLNINCTTSYDECFSYFSKLVTEAAKQGYDSIQFLDHYDMRCGKSAVEILMTKSIGKGIIPTNLEFRTGHNASKKCIPIKTGNCIKCKNT